MTHDPQGPESPHDRLLPPPGGPPPPPTPPRLPPPQLEFGDAEKVKVLQRELSPGCSPVFTLSRHSDRKRSATAAAAAVCFFFCFFLFPTWFSNVDQRVEGHRTSRTTFLSDCLTFQLLLLCEERKKKVCRQVCGLTRSVRAVCFWCDADTRSASFPSSAGPLCILPLSTLLLLTLKLTFCVGPSAPSLHLPSDGCNSEADGWRD